jgi:thiol-disulfide isomerase/thioredoxin
MRSLFNTIVCMFLYFVSPAQNNFIIRGRIDLLSKSKSIIINSPSGQFAAPINSDGSFKITGKVNEASISLLKTDSSVSDGIWLEPGEYAIVCKEITIDGSKGYFLRTTKLKGPKDAQISYGFNQTLYSLGGKTKEETKKNYSDFSLYYLDSIIRNFPTSKTIPQILSVSQPLIGDEATQVFRTMMDEGQKTDIYSNGLDNYFKRKEKIEREKVFQDFQMPKQDGTVFKFSSVNKKLILIDFWSSDCAPCRRKHLELVDLYQKYSSKGLEIVSVSLDYNDKEWRKAMLKDKMTWINVSELQGWKTSLAQDYFVNSLPFSLWLDKDKKIIKGEVTEKEIEEYLK